jgi:L-ribulose-5-phosphate 3-epimerase
MVRIEDCGILTDEVSDDFATAVAWAAEHGLGYVEIRSLWGSNVIALTEDQIRVVEELLARYSLRVSGIASPVFKCALDAAHPPQVRGDLFGSDEADLAQHEVWLTRALALASRLKAPYVRIFSFWREPKPTDVFSQIVAHLQQACTKAEAAGVAMVLENEPTCNGGSVEEVWQLVDAVNSPWLGVLWDPGNDAYAGVPVHPQQAEWLRRQLFHMHLKDVRVEPDGTRVIVPLGRGEVPWSQIFSALHAVGYQGIYTLEPHVGDRPWGLESSAAGLQALIATQTA